MRILPLFLMWFMSAVSAGQPVATLQVAYESIPQEQVFDASIEAVHQATVSAQTAGRIDAVYFDVDDYVSKGSVILRLRDKKQKAQLSKAEAGLKGARARLAEAENTFTRTKTIHQQKLVSKSVLDQATAGLKSATARLLAAQAQVREAQLQLDHTVVKAPYSGIVVKRHVQPGESATPGQPLMTGISLDTLRAVVNLPQQLIAQVRSRGKARVLLPGHEHLEISDIVIFPYADTRTHSFTLRLELPTGIKGLYPGMLVKIAFTTGVIDRMLVPASTLVFRSEVTAVYVVSDDGKTSLRQVRIGSRHKDGRVEVHAGLREGERIALDPFKAAMHLQQSIK